MNHLRLFVGVPPDLSRDMVVRQNYGDVLFAQILKDESREISKALIPRMLLGKVSIAYGPAIALANAISVSFERLHNDRLAHAAVLEDGLGQRFDLIFRPDQLAVLSHPHRVLADAEDDRDRLTWAADLVR